MSELEAYNKGYKDGCLWCKENWGKPPSELVELSKEKVKDFLHEISFNNISKFGFLSIEREQDLSSAICQRFGTRKISVEEIADRLLLGVNIPLSQWSSEQIVWLPKAKGAAMAIAQAIHALIEGKE